MSNKVYFSNKINLLIFSSYSNISLKTFWWDACDKIDSWTNLKSVKLLLLKRKNFGKESTHSFIVLFPFRKKWKNVFFYELVWVICLTLFSQFEFVNSRLKKYVPSEKGLLIGEWGLNKWGRGGGHRIIKSLAEEVFFMTRAKESSDTYILK